VEPRSHGSAADVQRAEALLKTRHAAGDITDFAFETLTASVTRVAELTAEHLRAPR
jgi:uncharacterized membrane protein